MLVGQKGVKYGLSLSSKGGGGGGGGDDGEKDEEKRRVAPASVANPFGVNEDDDEDGEEGGGGGAKRALQRDIARQAAKKASDAKVKASRRGRRGQKGGGEVQVLQKNEGKKNLIEGS